MISNNSQEVKVDWLITLADGEMTIVVNPPSENAIPSFAKVID
jgi:hypothetical protein